MIKKNNMKDGHSIAINEKSQDTNKRIEDTEQQLCNRVIVSWTTNEITVRNAC